MPKDALGNEPTAGCEPERSNASTRPRSSACTRTGTRPSPSAAGRGRGNPPSPRSRRAAASAAARQSLDVVLHLRNAVAPSPCRTSQRAAGSRAPRPVSLRSGRGGHPRPPSAPSCSTRSSGRHHRGCGRDPISGRAGCGGPRRSAPCAVKSNEPGTQPPTSDQWPFACANAMSSPSTKIGRTTRTSLKCVPPRYGSLMRRRRPGACRPRTPSMIAFAVRWSVPTCDGDVLRALSDRVAVASQSAEEKSRA